MFLPTTARARSNVNCESRRLCGAAALTPREATLLGRPRISRLPGNWSANCPTASRKPTGRCSGRVHSFATSCSRRCSLQTRSALYAKRNNRLTHCKPKVEGGTMAGGDTEVGGNGSVYWRARHFGKGQSKRKLKCKPNGQQHRNDEIDVDND